MHHLGDRVSKDSPLTDARNKEARREDHKGWCECLTVHYRTRNMRPREAALVNRLREIVDFAQGLGADIAIIENGDCKGWEDAKQVKKLTGECNSQNSPENGLERKALRTLSLPSRYVDQDRSRSMVCRRALTPKLEASGINSTHEDDADDAWEEEGPTSTLSERSNPEPPTLDAPLGPSNLLYICFLWSSVGVTR